MNATRDRKTGRVTLEMSAAEFQTLVRVMSTRVPARGLAYAYLTCNACGRVMNSSNDRHAPGCPVPQIQELERKALYECEHVRRRW